MDPMSYSFVRTAPGKQQDHRAKCATTNQKTPDSLAGGPEPAAVSQEGHALMKGAGTLACEGNSPHHARAAISPHHAVEPT